MRIRFDRSPQSIVERRETTEVVNKEIAMGTNDSRSPNPNSRVTADPLSGRDMRGTNPEPQ